MGSTDEIAGQRAERETAAVESLLLHGGPRLETLMASTEAHLELATADVGAALAGYVTAGGKRVRPMLVLLAAEASPTAVDSGRDEHLVRAAVAVELMHSATLAHDDVLDGARLRRGHPTVVAVAGRRAAIATGDEAAILTPASSSRARRLIVMARLEPAVGRSASWATTSR